ncbi:MAG: hypothetical protein ACKOB1_11640 [Planctomycetia bacterium]
MSGLVVVAGLLKHEPSLMATTPTGPDAERAAARMVTTGSALHAALGRAGPWEAAITDTEANAWLAVDLPRNHPTLVPRGLADPRVRFRPQRVEAAVRVGSGILSTVVWCDLGVALRGVNQVGITVEGASAGAVPIPGTPVLAELGRRIAACGAVTELRRLDGRMLLVVYIPAMLGGGGPQWRLESLRIDAGEAALAGSTTLPESAPESAAAND